MSALCVRGVRQLGEFEEQQLPHVYYTSVRGHFLQLFQLCQDAALQPDNLSELQEHFLWTILKGKHREGNYSGSISKLPPPDPPFQFCFVFETFVEILKMGVAELAALRNT